MQKTVTAAAGATEIVAVVLMATVMAVHVGRRGSPLAVSLVTSAYFLASLLFAPVWGAIADVTGTRRGVLCTVTGLATLSVLPLVVLDGIWTFIAVRFVFGAFVAGFPPVIFTIVSERSGASGRARSIGTFNSARSVGFTVAQLTAGALLVALMPGHVYLVIAGVGFLSFLTSMLVVNPTSSGNPNLSLSDLPAEVRTRLFPIEGGRDHLRERGLPWLYVGVVTRCVTWMGISSLLPVYLLQSVKTTEFAMGVLLALAPAAEIWTMYAFGRLADAVGRKSLITFGLVGHGAMAGLIASAAPLASPLVAGLGLLVKAISYGALLTGTVAFIGDVASPGRESELMGFRSTARGVGGVVGPPILGVIATLSSFEVAFAVGGVLSVFGGLLTHRFLIESAPASRAEVPGRPQPESED